MSEKATGALIEIGWVLAGDLDEQEIEAIRSARELVLRSLQALLPQFEWRMPVVYRRRIVQAQRVQPVHLLDAAASERAVRRWDFALLVTDAELVSYYTPWALGMTSRALGSAVMSLARLEPSYSAEARAPVDRIARRLQRLALHLLGHLNGLPHSEDDRTSLLSPVGAASDLDKMESYSGEELDRLRCELRDVADLRLEEQPGPRLGPVAFHAKTLRHNRDDIWSSVRQIAPWWFPLRFSRLTIAGISTMLILLLTAEAWDVAMTQQLGFVLIFAAVSVAGTSTFLIKRQRLLVRRGGRRLTEQTAVTNISVAVSTFVGMLTTWLLFFLFALAFSQAFFTDRIAASWAEDVGGPIGLHHYLVLSSFVATLGLVIGGLGASFEAESYFRHVAYVDEET